MPRTSVLQRPAGVDGPLAARLAWTVSVADVLRQIGHDERMHRLDSGQRAAEQAATRR